MSSLASFAEIVDAAARVRSAKMELAQCTSRLQSATARLENAYGVLRRATRRHFEECAICGTLAPFVDQWSETEGYRPDGDTAWSERQRSERKIVSACETGVGADALLLNGIPLGTGEMKRKGTVIHSLKLEMVYGATAQSGTGVRRGQETSVENAGCGAVHFFLLWDKHPGTRCPRYSEVFDTDGSPGDWIGFHYMRRELRDRISIIWHDCLEIGGHWTSASAGGGRDWKRVQSLPLSFEMRLGNRKTEFDGDRGDSVSVRNIKYGALYVLNVMASSLDFKANWLFNSRLYFSDVM